MGLKYLLLKGGSINWIVTDPKIVPVFQEVACQENRSPFISKDGEKIKEVRFFLGHVVHVHTWERSRHLFRASILWRPPAPWVWEVFASPNLHWGRKWPPLIWTACWNWMPNGAPRTRSMLAPSPPYVIRNNYIFSLSYSNWLHCSFYVFTSVRHWEKKPQTARNLWRSSFRRSHQELTRVRRSAVKLIWEFLISSLC